MKYESTEGRLYMSRSACIAAVRRQIGWMAKEGVHFTLHPKTATRSPFATTWVWERLEPKGQSTVPVDFATGRKEWQHSRDCAYVVSDGPAPCTCPAGELDSFGELSTRGARIEPTAAEAGFGPVIAAHNTVEAICRMVSTPDRWEQVRAVIERLDELAYDNEPLAITLKEIADELHALLPPEESA